MRRLSQQAEEFGALDLATFDAKDAPRLRARHSSLLLFATTVLAHGQASSRYEEVIMEDQDACEQSAKLIYHWS